MGGKRFTGSGGGGQVLDPPKIAFPTRGLFRGVGLSWDARRPITAAAVGAPAQRGPTGLWEAAVGVCLMGGRGGQGAAVGTLLCAGRLRRAPLAAHCGCDVSVEGRSRRTAVPQLPPAQAAPGEGNRRPGGGLGAVLLPLHKTFLIFKPAAGQSARPGKREARSPVFPFPVFSSRSLALSTTACTCPKYHRSHLRRGQLREQPSFHRGTGRCCSDMPSRAPGQGRVALGCSCCGPGSQSTAPWPPRYSPSGPCRLPGAVLSGITRTAQ